MSDSEAPLAPADQRPAVCGANVEAVSTQIA